MKRKVTCFTSMALVVLMAVSPVAGSSASVFAAEPSDETTAIQVIPEEDETSDEIVVETESNAIEIKKEMQASVKIGDAGESDIEVETEYQAGDSIPVHVTAENPTDADADFRLYFWDYGETLPEDKAEWSKVLTDACKDVKIAELQDTDKYAVDLKQGEDTVQSKASFASEKDDKDQLTAAYLSIEIPAEASLDTVFHISSDTAETVTIVPVFDAESENAFYGDTAVAQWKENPIVVEADETKDTGDENQILVQEQTEEDENLGTLATLLEEEKNEGQKVIAQIGDYTETLELETQESLDVLQNRFPQTLSITLEDGTREDIEVTWECLSDYEQTAQPIYVFEAVLPDGYAVHALVGDPTIEVVILANLSDEDLDVSPLVLFPDNPNGTQTIDKKIGCTKDIGQYLQNIYDTNKKYYLGTPYYDRVFEEPYTDWLLANGATADGKSGHMNCTGFVADVIRKCGGDLTKITQRRPGWYANASNWQDYAHGYQKQPDGTWAQNLLLACKTYRFDSISAALQSGVMEKGDIIFFEPRDWTEPGADCHIGFFFGKTSSENKFWHSSSHGDAIKEGTSPGNMISAITPKVPSYLYVFKTYHSPKKGGLSIQKQSANTSISNKYSNGCYSLAGAKYGVYSDSACKTLVTTITTDASGYAATKDDALTEGTYYVKETTASKGFKLDTKIYKFTVKGGTTAAQNKQTSSEPPKTGKILLQKKSGDADTTTGNNRYSIQGAEYTVYSNKVCTVKVGTIVTDASGQGSLAGLPLGVYFVKETKASTGFDIDTNVYSADISSGTTDEISVNLTSVEPVQFGELKIIKSSSSPTVTTGNTNYSLKGAEYTVYTDSSCKQAYGKITTDENGEGTLSNLPFGIYYVKETKAPKGYQLDTVVHAVTIPGTAVVTMNLKDVPKVGELRIIKQSADTSVTNNNSNYSLKGAVYTVYKDKACQQKVGTITTDENGSGSLGNLPLGTYYVKETKAPQGYQLDTEIYTAEIPDATVVTMNMEDKPEVGNLRIIKQSELPEISENNQCYSLAGAEFTIYKDAACKTVYQVIKTNADGIAECHDMPLGDYWVKETKAPKGFELNTNWTQKATVTASHTAEKPLTYTCKDVPGNDPTGIEITKLQNGDKTDTIPTLEGTQFTIKYYDGFYDSVSELPAPTRTWVLEVKEVGNTERYITGLTDNYLVDGSDELYYINGVPCLPYGTITIQETKPAAGYTLDGYLVNKDTGEVVSQNSEIYIAQINKDSGAVRLQGGNEFTGYNTPKSSKIKLKKFDSDGKNPLAGVVFEIKNSDGEVVGTKTTDRNGEIIFDNLYPDIYTITEKETVPGHSLLKDPIVVKAPMEVTEDYINDYNISKSKVTYDPATGTYYIYEFTYEITNDVTFKMPMSGGFTTPMTFVPLIAGMGIMGGLGVVGFRRKRKK